ncbi:MAG: hypothetical protein M5U08_11300 [Burkholderiales bacterium]|nr:hypothetical protein [Burkholderiales bacterium]
MTNLKSFASPAVLLALAGTAVVGFAAGYLLGRDPHLLRRVFAAAAGGWEQTRLAAAEASEGDRRPLGRGGRDRPGPRRGGGIRRRCGGCGHGAGSSRRAADPEGKATCARRRVAAPRTRYALNRGLRACGTAVQATAGPRFSS